MPDWELDTSVIGVLLTFILFWNLGWIAGFTWLFREKRFICESCCLWWTVPFLLTERWGGGESSGDEAVLLQSQMLTLEDEQRDLQIVHSKASSSWPWEHTQSEGISRSPAGLRLSPGSPKRCLAVLVPRWEGVLCWGSRMVAQSCARFRFTLLYVIHTALSSTLEKLCAARFVWPGLKPDRPSLFSRHTVGVKPAQSLY